MKSESRRSLRRMMTLPALCIPLLWACGDITGIDDPLEGGPAPEDRVYRLTIVPNEVLLSCGDTVQLTLEMGYWLSDDDQLAPTLWTSNDTTVASVSQDGLVVAKSAGMALISARVAEREDDATITVW